MRAGQTESRVFIVDDDAALRESIATLLTRVGYSVITFESAQHFLQDTSADDAGCVILDLQMPGMSGLELQHRLRRKGYRLPIVFLTGFADVRSTVQAIKGGAVDLLEKPITSTLLIERVRQALAEDDRGRRARAEVERIRSRFSSLTPREREVMLLVTQGMSNKEIASGLAISPRTVENHRANIMRKMRATSVAALCEFAAACRSETISPSATDGIGKL